MPINYDTFFLAVATGTGPSPACPETCGLILLSGCLAPLVSSDARDRRPVALSPHRSPRTVPLHHPCSLEPQVHPFNVGHHLGSPGPPLWATAWKLSGRSSWNTKGLTHLFSSLSSLLFPARREVSSKPLFGYFVRLLLVSVCGCGGERRQFPSLLRGWEPWAPYLEMGALSARPSGVDVLSQARENVLWPAQPAACLVSLSFCSSVLNYVN